MIFALIDAESRTAMHDPRIIAALISAAIGGLAGAFTLLIARWQLRAKLFKIEQAQRMKSVEIKQAHHAEVLKKRLEFYPKIWSVLLIYGRNWMIEGKETDARWAREFLEKLNACNAECGVIFSEPVCVADTMAHEPSRLVGTKSKLPLKLFG